MRAALAKEVRLQFLARMEESFPQFKRTKTAELSKSDLAFESKVGSNLTFYIALLLYHNQDEFCIEVGWSENLKFPTVQVTSLEESPREGQLRIRLSHFWGTEDIWWELAPRESLEEMVEKMETGNFFDEYPLEESMKKIRPHVADAISKIKKYAIPYFQKIAAEHGYDLKED